MNVWSHPFLDRPAEYSVANGRVLKGRVIIAYTFRRIDGGFNVATVDGRSLGRVESPAQAMLMVIRDHEGARR